MTHEEFVSLVAKMRQAQKDYFKTSDFGILNESKQLERKVDAENKQGLIYKRSKIMELKEVVYSTQKGNAVTDSVKLAEYLNRRHSNITKSIRRIIAQHGGACSMFFESTYINGGKHHPMFLMNRDGFCEVTKGIPSIGFEVSAILARFDSVQAGILDGKAPEIDGNAPKTHENGIAGESINHGLFDALQATETPEKSEEETFAYIIGKIEGLEKLIKAVIEMLDGITLSQSIKETPKATEQLTIKITNQIVSIGEFAKMLCQYGIQTGEMRLFQWMRDNRFLCAHGSEYNLPRQEYIEKGIFVIRASKVQLPTGQVVEKNTTKVTAKGQEYFIRRFLYQAQNNSSAK